MSVTKKNRNHYRMLCRASCLAVAAGFALVGTAVAQPAEPAPAPAPAAEEPAADPVAGDPAPVAAAEPAVVAPPAPVAPAPVVVEPAPAPPADGPRPPPVEPFKIETPSGSIKFGVLVQPQFEATGSQTLNSTAMNLFVRRTRILVGATLFKSFDFFFDTDFPDLFKADATGARNTNGLNIQDAFGTVKIAGDLVKLDLGYMLPATSHNGLQGAGTLYGWDYYANSFRHSNAFNSGGTGTPIGRDAGLQLRGLVAGGHLEYRLGAFQGFRKPVAGSLVQSRNGFRVAGRVQVNILDAEPGFFYGGTYLGAKKIISVGGGFDIQDKYRHASGDVFVDLPVGPGVLTAQGNFGYWNGGSTLTAFPEQSAIMAEAGYLINAINVSPIVRFENRMVVAAKESAANPDETRIGGGLAFWPYGHNINLKAFVMNITPSFPTPVAVPPAVAGPAAHSYLSFNIQAQLYAF
jgi:hypothetical protein